MEKTSSSTTNRAKAQLKSPTLEQFSFMRTPRPSPLSFDASPPPAAQTSSNMEMKENEVNKSASEQDMTVNCIERVPPKTPNQHQHSISQYSDVSVSVSDDKQANFIDLKASPLRSQPPRVREHEPKDMNTAKRKEPTTFTRSFEDSWQVDFKWLEYKDSEKLKKKAMFCTICEKHGGSGPFSDKGSTNFRRSALLEHGCSGNHLIAYQNSLSFEKLSEIRNNLQSKSMKCDDIFIEVVKFITKEDLALRKFGPLLQLIDKITRDDDAKQKLYQERYSGEYGCGEWLDSIANITKKKLLDKIYESSFYGLMFDESTSLGGQKYLIVYCIYTDRMTMQRFTSFLGLLELHALDAHAVEYAIVSYLNKCNLSIHKLVGISTDGASVMIGKNEGVVAKMKRRIGEHVISTHCAAHRLALACSNAGKDVLTLQTVDRILMNIYKSFRNSFVNKEILEKFRKEKSLTIKKYVETRWFSRLEVVQSVDENLEAIIQALQKIIETEDGSQFLKTLLNQILDVDFIGYLKFLLDLFKETDKIQLIFQREDLMLWEVDAAVTSIILRLRHDYLDVDGLLPRENLRGFLELTNLWPINNNHPESVFYKNNRLNIEFGTVKLFKSIKKYVGNLVVELETLFPEHGKYTMFRIFDVHNLLSIITSFTRHNQPVYDRLDMEEFGREDIEKIYANYTSNILLEHKLYDLQSEWSSMKFYILNQFHKCKDSRVLWGSIFSNPINREIYPIIYKVIQVCLVIPVHSVDCERGFSRMNLIKTDMRNRLSKFLYPSSFCHKCKQALRHSKN
jgi:hypothetical protein